MVPAAVSNTETLPSRSGKTKSYPKPLKSSGALAKFKWEDVTPVLGREFPTVNLVDDILHAANSDELVRDLAIDSALAPEVSKCCVAADPDRSSQFRSAV